MHTQQFADGGIENSLFWVMDIAFLKMGAESAKTILLRTLPSTWERCSSVLPLPRLRRVPRLFVCARPVQESYWILTFTHP